MILLDSFGGAPVVFGEERRLDVHAAIVASRLFRVTRFTIERTAVKELLKPRSFAIVEVHQFGGQRLPIATAIALADILLVQNRSVMIVDALGHDAGARAQRTRHP